MTNKIFEGLGPGTLVPQRGKLLVDDRRLGAAEGVVLSRVDGRTSLEEICLLVPFDEPVAMMILRRLWELGAIEVPGVARVLPRQTSSQSLPAVAQAAPAILPSARADAHPIPADQRRRIDDFFEALDRKNAFDLLEIDLQADGRAVKRAYFKLSKEFHPDRYFGREIGEYGDRLSKIFQAIKAAFELLSNEERRAAYEEAAGLK